MSENGLPAQILRFGDCELDMRSGELRRNGDRLLLAEQPLRILAVLLRQPGALVTRDDLSHELWPDGTFVDFEHSLNAAIKRLREALGDIAAAPRFIQTVPRRGYRFVAAVHTNAPTQSVTAEPPAARQRNRDGLRRRLILAIGITALLVIGFSPGARWLSVTKSAISAKSRLVRLTSTAGLNTEPTVSPDGSLLAYASDRDGTSGFDIWVQPVAGGDPLRLSSSRGDEAEPAFSPDGAQIIFTERESGTINLVGTFGGGSRVLARAQWARTPRFSPDGRWVVYWTGFLPTVVPRGLPGATGSVFIVPSTGGSPHQLVPHFASARYPIWSPDSRHILFLGEESAKEESYDWYVAAIDGSAVTKTGAIQALQSVRLIGVTPVPGGWRARDDAVVFATNETDRSNIWQIPISRSTGRVSGDPQRLTFGAAVERGPSVTESGRIAFTSVVEKVGIWRAPLDASTGVASGPFEPVTEGTANERLRNASYDGRVLAFLSSRTGRDEVWIRYLATGREVQVSHAGGKDASLSPNGSTIAFAGSEAGKEQIDIADTAAGLPRNLCSGCGVPSDWSPDGRRLLLSRGIPSRLIVYDMSSGKETVAVAHEKWSLFQARFSPDGRWVAFHTANSPNARQVYAAPVSPERLAAPEAWVPVVSDHGCHPNWSSDGSLLYHFSFRDGAFCPWVQRIDPATKRPIGEPRAVWHLHEPRLRAALGAAATNDVQAGYLYITATETTGNIWMLEHDSE